MPPVMRCQISHPLRNVGALYQLLACLDRLTSVGIVEQHLARLKLVKVKNEMLVTCHQQDGILITTEDCMHLKEVGKGGVYWS